MTWFIFLFGWTLQIHCFNFLNVRKYCSELTVAPHCKNSTNKIPFCSQNVLPMTTKRNLHLDFFFFLYPHGSDLWCHSIDCLAFTISLFHSMLEKFCTDVILSFLCFQYQPCTDFSVAKFSDEGSDHQFSIPYCSTLFTRELSSSQVSTSTLSLTSVVTAVAGRPQWACHKCHFQGF